jgi:hypothetical protein
MTTLIESPWPAIFFGIIALAILAVVLVRTGRGIVLVAMAGVLLVTLAGVVIERLVVTERERVEDTLYGAAAAIEANDVNRVMQYVSASAPYTPARARSVLSQYHFTEARISNVQIQINDLTSPPTATAKMIGIFSVTDTLNELPYNNGRVGLTVHLRRENGRWLVTGHEEGDPRDYL